MTNFDFLKNETQFASFSDACIEAEKSIAASPALCALGVRKSAELAVKWLYSVDRSLHLPYKDNFSALVFNPSFTAFVDQNIINSLRFIIKLGNFSAHTNKKVAYREAVLALQNLFEFVLFIDYCYGSSYEDRTFDETLLADDTKQSISAQELTRLRGELETKSAEREALMDEMKSLQEELARLRTQNTAERSYVPHVKTEDETRRTIIDLDLKAMGWTFDVDCMREVPVIGMPSTSGKGFADYVLYGRDHKPLAVIEAKKTTVSPEAGREQARIYADCLEQMTGQRPLIFYTNGYDTYFWDDLHYPPRQVYSVFSQDDLQRIVSRRTQARTFETLKINPAITDRAYQKEAIHSVCTAFAAHRRKALLVMATGTGKTRTVISLVDVLLSHGWITNILFLADRIELVRQAKQAFTEHLPNLSTCNLLERDGSSSARAIFSTYPTIMNAIDEMKTKDGARLFTPGHFDLIVIDEAHRSIFKKYRAIFRYFDALIVGLTATPKTDVDHNTYDFFDMENDMPTYAYEYDTALAEGYLADYHCIAKLLRIPTKGITYEELSPEERERYEDAFDESEELPETITSGEINHRYFNVDTTRQVLSDLMEKGLKIEGGDKLGKTIIFARSHRHAEHIEKEFDRLYPQYRGEFARVIDHAVKNHAKLLSDFRNPDKLPQIAISVDMLDTGIDIHEILNLVFYKQVFSKAKFWQMFGRGTRLCKDLFGAGADKTMFYIFDYMGNFAFFSQNPKSIESTDTGSLAEKTFGLKVRILRELQAPEYQSVPLTDFRASLASEVHDAIAALNKGRFEVRAHLSTVEKYAEPAALDALDIGSSEEIIAHLAPLIPAVRDDESARRLDVILYRMMHARAAHETPAYERSVKMVQGIAARLESKKTIPDVKAQESMLVEIRTPAFWKNADLPQIDRIRRDLRGLMQYLRAEIRTKEINITDEIISEQVGARLTKSTELEGYRERANRYVKENEGHPLLTKLRNNIPLSPEEWAALEHIFWNEIGTVDEYNNMIQRETDADPPASLGTFIRSLTGLSAEAARAAFSEFLDTALYNEEQITLIHNIMEWVMRNGTMDVTELGNAQNFGGASIVEVFHGNTKTLQAIARVLRGIKTNAAPTAA